MGNTLHYFKGAITYVLKEVHICEMTTTNKVKISFFFSFLCFY